MAIADDNASRWLSASEMRVSRRSFAGQAPDPKGIDRLADVCHSFRPFGDARVELVEDPPADVFGGIRGSYGTIRGARSVLVFIAEQRSPAAQRHLGYTGEAVVLEATALELGTCWVGGFFDKRRARSIVELSRTEQVYAVSPVGVPTEQFRFSERSMRGMAAADRRKSLDEIGPGHEQWPEWARAALREAQRAPSASNRQPWRFSMQGTALVVARDSGRELPIVDKRLDIGIATLHAELGARGAGTHGEWVDIPARPGSLEVARFVAR